MSSQASTPMTVRLSFEDATGATWVTFDRPDLTLLPGTTQTANATVRGNTTGNWSVRIVAQETTALGGNGANRATATLAVRIAAPPTNATTNQTSPPPGGNTTSPPANTTQGNATAPPANGTQGDGGNGTQPANDSTPPAGGAWILPQTLVEVDARDGTRTDLAVRIDNPSDAPATIALTMRLPLGWGGSLVDTSLTIPARSSATARGSVTPAAGAQDAEGTLDVSGEGRSARVRLVLRAPAAPLQEPVDADPGPTTMPPAPSSSEPDGNASARPSAPRATIRLDPDEIGLPAGASVPARVVIANPTSVAVSGRITIQITDVVARFEDDFFLVAPGAEVAIPIVLTMPEGALVGAQHFGVVAAAGLEPSEFLVRVAAADSVANAASVSTQGDARILLAASVVGLGAAALAGAAAWRRWPGLGLFALYARLAPRRALEHPRREAMLSALRAEPGLTLAALQKRLGLSNGVARHHLALLEAAGVVRSSTDGALRRLWPLGAAIVSAPALADRAIAMLRERGEMRAADLADALGVSRQSLHYHLKRLEAEGRLRARREGGELILLPTAS